MAIKSKKSPLLFREKPLDLLRHSPRRAPILQKNNAMKSPPCKGLLSQTTYN